MKYKRILFFYAIFFIGAGLSFGFGYMTHLLQNQNKMASVKFPILEEGYEVLKNHAYVELPKEPAIEYGMIKGMVDAYDDPYTRFVEPVQHELETDQLSGRYGGIGSSLDYDSDGYIILHPFPKGPARDVGIKDGDRLMSVDDFKILPNTPLDQVIAAIRGPEGTQVKIIITRPPEFDIHSFDIERKDISIPSVTWYQESTEPRLGFVKVNLIAETTEGEILEAIENLKKQQCTHFVLDLRGNRGGILSTGVDIARLFLENGVIIHEHYRNQEIKTYEVEKPGPFFNIPLVVFVNNDTASAAEIIAGAIKYQKRAKIIGTETFGKNSIQLVFSLQDESSLHVTAAKWWTPDLASETGFSGIQPDVFVTEDSSSGDPFKQAATNIFFGQP